MSESYVKVSDIQEAIDKVAEAIGEQDKGRQSDEYLKAGARAVVIAIQKIVKERKVDIDV